MDFTTYTARSGEFLGNPQPLGGLPPGMSPATVYNPGVLQQHRGSYEFSKTFENASDRLIRYSTRYRMVRESDIIDYGQKLVEFGAKLSSTTAHCYLGPLRGAAKPCVIGEVMSKHNITYDFFDSRGCGTTTESHPGIITSLQGILRQRDPGEEIFRINLTDTARGGQGINALVPLIKGIHDGVGQFQHQKWQLDLHLFNDSKLPSQIENIRRVTGLASPGSFDINLTLYSVPSLVVEDYEPALAFQLFDANGAHRFKPSTVKGQFLYRVGNETSVVESEDAYRTFEELYSEAITQNLTTSPNYTLGNIVWNEYQLKA